MINIRKTIFLILLCQSLTVYSLYNPLLRPPSFQVYHNFFNRSDEFIQRISQSGINQLLKLSKSFPRFSLFQANGELKITPWITLAGLCVFLGKTASLRKTILFSFVDPFYDYKVNIDDDINPKNKKFFHISKIAAIGVDGAFYYSAKYCAHMFRHWLNNNSTSRMFEKKDIPVLLCSVLLSLEAVKRAVFFTENILYGVRTFEREYFLVDHQGMETAYKNVMRNFFRSYCFEYPLAFMYARRYNFPIETLPSGIKHFDDLYDELMFTVREKKMLIFNKYCIEKQEENEREHITGLTCNLANQVFKFLDIQKY